MKIGICLAGVRSTDVQPVELGWDALVERLSTPVVGQKDGPYFTRCAFKDNRRTEATAEPGALVVLDGDMGLDFETGEVSKEIPAPPPADVHAALVAADITHIIFTTHSHTPERPRYRVVIPLGVANKAALTDAVDAATALLHAAGVPLASVKENYTFAQAWYLPRVPSAEALEHFVALHHTGAGLLPQGHGTGVGNTLETWAAELLRGGADQLHDSALRITMRMVHAGLSEEDIWALFSALRPVIQRARGARRTAELYDRGELKRAIDGAFKKADARVAAIAEAQRIGEGERRTSLHAPILSLDDMLERLVFAKDGSRVIDRTEPRWPLALEDAGNTYAASKELSTTPGGKSRTVPALKLWIPHSQRLCVHGTTFRAGAGEFCDDPLGRHCINTWMPPVRAVGDPTLPGVVLLVDHIHWLFGDRAEEFLDWLAAIEQRPGELPHRGWLHIAPHTGMGRNTLASALARVWAGHTGLAINLTSILNTTFNDELSNKLLAVVDEIREGSRADTWKHAEAMKRLITEEVRHINPKYGRKSVEFNACRWLMFSNHRDALPLDETDRRVEVVINYGRPKNSAYYDALVAAVKDADVIAGFATLLGQRDLSKYRPGTHAALTTAKRSAIAAGRGSAAEAIATYVDDRPERELFMSKELSAAGCVSSVGGEAAVFKRAVEHAGLLKLDARVRLSDGERYTVYCRLQAVQRWQGWRDERVPDAHCPLKAAARESAGGLSLVARGSKY